MTNPFTINVKLKVNSIRSAMVPYMGNSLQSLTLLNQDPAPLPTHSPFAAPPNHSLNH